MPSSRDSSRQVAGIPPALQSASMQTSTRPEPAPVVDLIEAFRRSKVMFAAVSLGIFDLLERAPSDLQTLAHSLGANADALERLLDSCVSLGFLEKEHGRYSNLPVASTYLVRSSPNTLVGYILYSNNALYPLWGHLEDAVREGTHRWKQTFGTDQPIYDQFFKTDQDRRDFLLGMHGFGQISSPPVVAAFDLGRFKRLVDLGGATGHLPMAACARYPSLRAAVFDLPATIKVAQEFIERAGFKDRIELIPGDFFRDPLPEADLYSLGRILHDWSEGKIRSLLRKVHERVPRGGALLIAERLLNEDKTGPVASLMQSLSMLVCTEGKERTLSEYTALLKHAGFAEVQGRKTGAPLDAVLAVKG
jgi:acetylserotonin N-methyltransferase